MKAQGETMTDIAVKLLNGEGGPMWRQFFIDSLKSTPKLFQEVDPKYQKALKELLDKS